MDGSRAAPSGGPLVGVGGAEERVDELPRTRRDAAESGEDQGDEGASLIDTASAVISVFLFLAGEEHELVILGGGGAARGEDRVGDSDVDGD